MQVPGDVIHGTTSLKPPAPIPSLFSFNTRVFERGILLGESLFHFSLFWAEREEKGLGGVGRNYDGTLLLFLLFWKIHRPLVHVSVFLLGNCY